VFLSKPGCGTENFTGLSWGVSLKKRLHHCLWFGRHSLKFQFHFVGYARNLERLYDTMFSYHNIQKNLLCLNKQRKLDEDYRVLDYVCNDRAHNLYTYSGLILE
jgi:hypothetical protein